MESYYNTGDQTTGFENLTFEAMAQKLEQMLASGSKSRKKIMQAIHNYYAKKLHIPAVKLNRYSLSEDESAQTQIINNNRIDNISVLVDSKIESRDGLLYVFDSIIHETKHVQQTYLFHKFVKHGTLPKSDYEKALVLFYLLWKQNGECSKCDYYLMLNEIDAHLFEFEESARLAERYGFFNTAKHLETHYNKVFDFLYALRYDKQGANNPCLKQSIKALKKDIYAALHGKFGEDVKRLVELLTKDFNIDNAFETVFRKLDLLFDEIYLTAKNAQEAGYDVSFTKSNDLFDINTDELCAYVLNARNPQTQLASKQNITER